MAIEPRERLILALDVPSADEAKRLLDRVRDAVACVKIGLELFTAAGPDIVRWALAQRKRGRERLGRIERHVRAAGLQDAEEGDEHRGSALDADRDSRLRPDAPALEHAREKAGAGVELAVGQDLALGEHAHVPGVRTRPAGPAG